MHDSIDEHAGAVRDELDQHRKQLSDDLRRVELLLVEGDRAKKVIPYYDNI